MDPEIKRGLGEQDTHPAEVILRGNLPDYPPELLGDLDRDARKIAKAKQRVQTAVHEGNRKEAEIAYDLETFYQNSIDYRLKRFNRRQKVRQFSKGLGRLLHIGRSEG